LTGLASIAEAADYLIARPKPVLCLDTCDLLDIVEGFTDSKKGSLQAKAVRSMIERLEADPDRFQIVITYLVEREWGQNLEKIRNKASNFLRETDKRVAMIDDVLQHAAVDVGRPLLQYSDLPLVQSLVDMAEDLVGRSIILSQEGVCVDRALARVIEQQRPSRNGNIKDSIHLEHYLELSKALGRSQFSEPRLFVSANKSDYWEGSPEPHPELRGGFDEAGLQFFGKLDAAVGVLRI